MLKVDKRKQEQNPIDILLVRHGEAAASWNKANNPGLSELGLQQANILVSEMEKYSMIESIVSSPLRRAQETAEPLAKTLGLPVAIERAYRELPSPAVLGKRSQWLRERMAESWSQQEDQLQRWRQEACEILSGLEKSTAIFSHFMLINAVVSELTGEDTMVCFQPDNGSITHLQIYEGDLTICALGAQLETRVN